MKCSRCKVRLNGYILTPLSSGILGSPEKGWASFPEWPAGGAVSEQISQSLQGKAFSSRQGRTLWSQRTFEMEGVLESPAFPEGDAETKEGMLLSCSHDRARDWTQATCIPEGDTLLSLYFPSLSHLQAAASTTSVGCLVGRACSKRLRWSASHSRAGCVSGWRGGSWLSRERGPRVSTHSVTLNGVPHSSSAKVGGEDTAGRS